MYTLGCKDTTTVVMNYLSLKQLRSLLCVNTDLYNIRNSRYYSIRVIQEFFKKYKKIKGHENKYSCRKITLTHLIDNSEKYIGKTIQFILRKTASRNKVLWHCKFAGIYRHNHFRVPRREGILAMHIGHIWQNMCKNSNHNRVITKLDYEDKYTFFLRKCIYEYSVRIIK